MRVLHLFAGGGGGILADLLLGHRVVGAVEWEPAAQAVLAARQSDGSLPPFPIFGDVRAFVDRGYARCYRGVADCVAGGFPCQPFSVAGKRAGHADVRNMWPAMRDVIAAVLPRWVFAENVPGLLSAHDGGTGPLDPALAAGRRYLDAINDGTNPDPADIRLADSIWTASRPVGQRRVGEAPADAVRYFGTVLGDLAGMGFDARWGVLGADDAGAPHRRKRLWIVGHRASGGR